MNAISSIETRMLLETPIIIGAVSRNSDRGTESWVRSRELIAGFWEGHGSLGIAGAREKRRPGAGAIGTGFDLSRTTRPD
jgi:hypothetical protein